MTLSCPEELRRLYREGRVLPFVGAGVSMSVSWSQDGRERRGVSWGELVNEAARQLGATEPELLRFRGSDLQILEYFRLKNEGFAPLTNWLHANMRPPDAVLQRSPIHSALAKLERCGVFYTTNFDDFLERALELNGRAVRAIASEHTMSFADDKAQVVKFHGDFNHPDAMVLSESQYQQRMKLETPMDLKLRSDVLGRVILFLGYSFRDPNIAYMFRLVNDQFGRLPRSFAGKRAYILVTNPSDFELQLFDERGIEVIPSHEIDRTRAVTLLLQDLIS